MLFHILLSHSSEMFHFLHTYIFLYLLINNELLMFYLFSALLPHSKALGSNKYRM